MNNRAEDIKSIIKVFGMTNQLIVDDLSSLEKKYDLELGHLTTKNEKETEYYPQFEQSVRSDAANMASYYELFYCLEKSIRKLITEAMEEEEQKEWWTSDKIPQNINDEVEKRIEKEVDSGVSRRSFDKLDYTTFGELSVIITKNWDIFGSIFNSKKAVEKVLGNLNTLRGPIAHCSLLSEDEVLRLKLTVKDWFRLME